MMTLNLRGESSREVMGELREMLVELYPQGILDGEEDLPGAAEQHAIAFGRQRLTVEEPLRGHGPAPQARCGGGTAVAGVAR